MINVRDSKGRIAPSFTQKQREWVVEHQFSFSSLAEFCEMFEKQFNRKLSQHGLYGILRKETGHRSIRRVKGTQSKDYLERKKFLEKNYPYRNTQDVVKEFNKKFGTNYNSVGIRDYCRHMGIRKDRNFKRTMPECRKPIGHIIKGFIKYKDDKVDRKHTMRNYMSIRNYIYIQNYGDIPKGYLVLAYDGSKDNNDPANLYAVNRKELLWLTTIGCLGKGNITRAALENIRLEQLLTDKGVIKKPEQNSNLSRLKGWKKYERETI